MLNANTAVDWWFVFKFNAGVGPGCDGQRTPACIFGGKPANYADYDGTVQWGQHYAVASSANPAITAPASPPGNTCVGDSADDPIGATYSKIYNGNYFYVVWNDQFYAVLARLRQQEISAQEGRQHARLRQRQRRRGQPAFLRAQADQGRSVAGAQGAGQCQRRHRRQEISNLQERRPEDVRDAAKKLGAQSKSATATIVTLSSGVKVISKPSNLLVPPWQMVSALLSSQRRARGRRSKPRPGGWIWKFRRRRRRQGGEIAATAILLGGYVIAALAFSTIYRATVLLSLRQLGMGSLHLSGLSALAQVKASGRAISAVGEGLADALNMGGY